MRPRVAFRYNNDMGRIAMLSASSSIVTATAVIAAAFVVACTPADDHPAPKDAGGDTASAPTYTKDVQPIFKAKCVPCHDGNGLGGHDIAKTYDDVKKLMPETAFDAPMECWKDVDRTMPKTIGECALIAVKLGRMPYQKGCDRPMPDDPSACVSTSEIAILEKWVAAGMPE